MKQQLKEWEERFEKESPLAFGGREWAKSFFKQELLSLLQRKSEEIEGLKKKIDPCDNCYNRDQMADKHCINCASNKGFNSALTSAQAILLKG